MGKHDAWLEEQKPEDPEVTALKQKLKNAETVNARLSKQLGLVEAYHAGAGKAPRWISPQARRRPGTALACLQVSDLHLDEVVNPAEIGGINAYDRSIAEMRLKRWADKAVELGKRYQHAWDGAVVFFGGDFVSGSIHEELRETNADVLPGTMVHWAPLLAAALGQVADYYKRVHVPVVVGNHGRLTRERPFKRRGRNSWDWMLAQLVKSHFANDPRVTFDIAEGSYLFVPMYDTHAFLSHGDEVSGGSGWAGVFTPLGTLHRKAIELAGVHNLPLSYSVVGHWHQCLLAHQRGFSLNGALKGHDEFAAGLRFRPEPPSQNFWVHTPEHGVTVQAPIYVQDKRREGW